MKSIALLALALTGAFWTVQKPTPDELYIHYRADHEIRGDYLRAYDSALRIHQKYMKREKGITVENYMVLMQEDKTYYRIHFVPRNTPGLPPLPLGVGMGGRLEGLYAVDKKTFKVLQEASGG